jgi:L-ribulose-5-phosphate 3-epimerase
VRIAVSTASYIARESRYPQSGWRRDDSVDPFLEGWPGFESRIDESFRAIETYEARFGELASSIAALGADAVEIWMGHLNPEWASDEHVALARGLFDEHGLSVLAYNINGGPTPESVERVCTIAEGLGAGLIVGDLALAKTAPAQTAALLRRHALCLAIANQREQTTPTALLRRLDDSYADAIGITLDTGWWGTHDYDAADAIKELAPHIMHVHLTDVREPGRHDTCLLGRGCVPIDRCLEALQDIGYTCSLTLEHPRPDADPSPDIRSMVESLKIVFDADNGFRRGVRGHAA